MISVSGKKWIEKKINKNTIEKIKQDFNFSEIISKLIIHQQFLTILKKMKILLKVHLY